MPAGDQEGIAGDWTLNPEWKAWLLQQGAMDGMAVGRVLCRTCGCAAWEAPGSAHVAGIPSGGTQPGEPGCAGDCEGLQGASPAVSFSALGFWALLRYLEIVYDRKCVTDLVFLH